MGRGDTEQGEHHSTIARAKRSLAAFLAVVSHCTVHNTLRQEPDITIELA